MKALIIIDLQNDFLPGGALAVKEGDIIIAVVNALQKKFPLIVATQDWHPQNHGSFASNHRGKNAFEMGQLGGMPQVLWPDHCIQGKSGAEISADLHTNAIEAIFRKGTDATIDSYSGFFDNGKLKATGLSHFLKGRNVSDIYLAGLAADFCLGYTALDGLELDFNVFVIEDATRAIDENGWIQMKQKIRGNGGKIVHSNDL